MTKNSTPTTLSILVTLLKGKAKSVIVFFAFAFSYSFVEGFMPLRVVWVMVILATLTNILFSFYKALKSMQHANVKDSK